LSKGIIVIPGRVHCSEDGFAELIREIHARIADRRQHRREVAEVYALLISLNNAQREQVPWGAINDAIAARWSWAAVSWIKQRAWATLQPRRVQV
jgi:hypothetical protein